MRRIVEVPQVRHIVVVAPQESVPEFADLLRGFDASEVGIEIVPGGAERTHSVRRGLQALPDGLEVVLVHDAARALTPSSVFERVVHAVRGGADGVVPVLPVVDTVKRVGGADRNEVVGTVDRDTLRAVQTPQGFAAGVLRAVYSDEVNVATDDAGLLENAGYAVRTVVGDPRAMKVTTQHDLAVAQLFL